VMLLKKIQLLLELKKIIDYVVYLYRIIQ